MNKAIITGRFTREPEIRHSNANGEDITIARGTLAVDRPGKKKEGDQTADFIPIVAFRHTADFIEKWCHQGTKLNVCGHLQTGSYTDRDGRRVYTTDVICEEVEFGESKGSGTTGSGSKNAAAAGSETMEPKDESSGFMSIPDGVPDDGLPFC